ncbi:MAG: energy transducer TonB [Blastocatellia bacterium]|nr:energy transducer TonB [Blastocatellia bacterium]
MDRKALIRKTPRPEYTDEARARRIQGNVVVRVVLGADRTVKAATVVRGLGYGLDEKAIDVAMKTVFEPALDRRGEPIDSTLTISVNFTIR